MKFRNHLGVKSDNTVGNFKILYLFRFFNFNNKFVFSDEN